MFKPLLAPNEDPLKFPDYFDKLQYPLWCSPKYDGIRGVVKHGSVLSRSGLRLPSRQVQELYSAFAHFDGEIIEGNPQDFGVYNRTQSHVMSHDKPGNLSFHVFDFTHEFLLNEPFSVILAELMVLLPERADVMLIPHIPVHNLDELLAYEDLCLDQGFEGIMMRNPNAPYKQGRATFRQNIIYKLKRFEDAEAEVVGFEEQMHNDNELEKDELGYAKRSTKKDGLKAADTLGKFLVEFQGQTITVAPGAFTHPQRKYIWENQNRFLGELLKFRFFNHGSKNKPRQPRAVGWRDKMDL
jgi:DNA ligase-1